MGCKWDRKAESGLGKKKHQRDELWRQIRLPTASSKQLLVQSDCRARGLQNIWARTTVCGDSMLNASLESKIVSVSNIAKKKKRQIFSSLLLILTSLHVKSFAWKHKHEDIVWLRKKHSLNMSNNTWDTLYDLLQSNCNYCQGLFCIAATVM